MPKITLTIRCASRDYFLKEQGIESYFESVVSCLNQQTFKDFEFVYVDVYQQENREKFSNIKTNFTVKHVDVHPNHRYWYDRNFAFMTAATNTAIIHADGELIVSLDDAEFFNYNLLEKYWNHYTSGNCMHACHRRLKSINSKDGKISLPIGGDIYINDSRMGHLKNNQIYKHNHGDWLYAGKSFTLKDALTLNGFNEKLDGCSSLEDCEFGVRLQLLGRKFVLDKEGCVFILDHKSYVEDLEGKKISRNFIAIENYGLVRCAIELNELVANKNPLTKKHFDIINRETLKYRKFDIFSEDNKERFAIWKNVPVFDLVEERKQLRGK